MSMVDSVHVDYLVMALFLYLPPGIENLSILDFHLTYGNRPTDVHEIYCVMACVQLCFSIYGAVG